VIRIRLLSFLQHDLYYNTIVRHAVSLPVSMFKYKNEPHFLVSVPDSLPKVAGEVCIHSNLQSVEFPRYESDWLSGTYCVVALLMQVP